MGNSSMIKSGKVCTGSMGASSKLNRNSTVSLAGGSALKTSQSSSVKLVKEKKENHQRGALSNDDARSVGESKFGKQLSQLAMRKNISAPLTKETSQSRSIIPSLSRKSGIPMPSRVTTSSLKVRSQIPTCI